MSSSPPKDKKITSLSFTEQSSTIKDEQKKHFRQFRSHEQKNRHSNQEKSMKQKASLNKMLSKSIDEQNELNRSKKGLFLWQVLLIDQKRTLTGIKVRIKCNMVPGQLYIVIRLSFTLEFFRLNGKLQQGTVFIQLDELNFQLNKAQKRMFQTELEKQMKPILSRTIYMQDEEEHTWVMEMFKIVEEILQGNQYKKRNKKVAQFLNRKEILTKYILYHPPVCLTWSPKGLFCLTQNKVPANKGSFIGNPLSFKLNIQVPKVSHLNTVNQQELTQSNTQQPDTQLSLFSWDMSQEMELFALNNHKRELSSYYKDNSRKDIESKKKLTSTNSLINSSIVNVNNGTNNNNSTFKPSDTMILKCSSKMTSTMKKIYQRHFSSKNDFQYEIARGQKLNVYFVLGQNRRHQDQMLYLMQRINIQRLRPPIQVILCHMLASHPNLLSIQQGNALNTIKYFVISQLFKQQNSTKSISSSQFNLSTCLKSIMVQNEFHALELERYLVQCFRQIGLNNAKLKYDIYQLGSYLYFDEYKAERILMRLLQQYEYHYELNIKNQKEVRFILQSKNIQRIKKHIKIKNIVKFPPLKEDWLLTDDFRKQFVQTILPVLIIRDRNYEDFYYKQLERIIATNQKIIKFYKNLSQIIKKIEDQRHDFIKLLVNQFTMYEKDKRVKQQSNQVRRQFTVYCQKCQRPNKTYEIDEAEKLRICSRCLETTNKKM